MMILMLKLVLVFNFLMISIVSPCALTLGPVATSRNISSAYFKLTTKGEVERLKINFLVMGLYYDYQLPKSYLWIVSGWFSQHTVVTWLFSIKVVYERVIWKMSLFELLLKTPLSIDNYIMHLNCISVAVTSTIFLQHDEMG